MTARDAQGRFVSGSGTSGAARIVDTDKGLKAMLDRIYGMRNPKIKVGILAGAGADQARIDNEALSLLFVAICNEFGTYDAEGRVHVPERSFIRAWFDEAEPRLRQDLSTLVKQVTAGTLDKSVALQRLALKCVGEVQARIATSIPPPNADSTVRRKGSSTTLINHGQLRAGVTHLVIDE